MCDQALAIEQPTLCVSKVQNSVWYVSQDQVNVQAASLPSQQLQEGMTQYGRNMHPKAS